MIHKSCVSREAPRLEGVRMRVINPNNERAQALILGSELLRYLNQK